MKKTINKRIFKWIKYAFIFSVFLLIFGVLFVYIEGRSIYGGLTKLVPYEQFDSKKEILAIKNANILSKDGNGFIHNQTILIEKGIITAIDTVIDIPNKATIIDGSKKFLIPGLIDAHVHLFQSENDLLLYIANGVTEIREMIGEKDHLKWRDEIDNGRIGPKMFVASPRLGTFGTINGWFMEYSQGYLNVKNKASAKKTIEDLYKEGYDGVKIYSQITKENYQTITETAKALEMPVFGHVSWDVTLEDVYKNGQNGIAHFEELVNALRRAFKKQNNLSTTFGQEDEFLEYLEAAAEELADNLLMNDITVTSTLWLTQSFQLQKFDLDNLLKQIQLEYQNPGISEWSTYISGGIGWLPEVNRYKISKKLNENEIKKEKKYWYTYGLACELLGRSLYKKGVRIMAGTDANLPTAVPGFSLHDELETLGNIGMTNAEILKSATSVPANWLKSNTGRIEIGYEANLVLLDKNPLLDIKYTRSINTVIVDSNVFDRDLLDKILLAVKEANDKSRTINIDQYLN